jgi:hypothetical protein
MAGTRLAPSRTLGVFMAVVSLLVMGGAVQAKQVNLEFEVTTVDDPAELKGMMKAETLPAAQTTTTSVVLGLGETYISVRRGAQKTVYALASRRLYRVDVVRSQYVEESLYAPVGFRLAELRNRMMLGSAMAKAKIDKAKNPFDRFQVESVLGVEWGGPGAADGAPEIKMEEAGGTLTFVRDGQWAVKFTPSKTDLPEAVAGRLTQCLAYECYVHPQIRRAILKTGKVPEKLEYRAWNPPHAYSVTWVLKKMSEAEAADLPLGKELKPAPLEVGPLTDILAEIKNRKAPARTEAQAFVKAAVAEKKYLDAMLAAVECNLQYGDDASLLKEVQPFAKTDPPLKAYIDALFTSNDPETAAQAMAALDGIKRAGLTKGYVIDIARAVTLTTLGRPKEAVESYLAALKRNPFIAGAYKDLGDLAAASFDMPLAWKYWDTGRAISPTLPMLQVVNQREAWLLKNVPDFFLAPKEK